MWSTIIRSFDSGLFWKKKKKIWPILRIWIQLIPLKISSIYIGFMSGCPVRLQQILKKGAEKTYFSCPLMLQFSADKLEDTFFFSALARKFFFFFFWRLLAQKNKQRISLSMRWILKQFMYMRFLHPLFSWMKNTSQTFFVFWVVSVWTNWM